MILHLSGLAWQTESPSHYRLAPQCVRPGCNLDISFVGASDRPGRLGGGGWLLFLEQHGHVSTRCFDNRDQAIGMVAQAYQREGVI